MVDGDRVAVIERDGLDAYSLTDWKSVTTTDTPVRVEDTEPSNGPARIYRAVKA